MQKKAYSTEMRLYLYAEYGIASSKHQFHNLATKIASLGVCFNKFYILTTKEEWNSLLQPTNQAPAPNPQTPKPHPQIPTPKPNPVWKNHRYTINRCELIQFMKAIPLKIWCRLSVSYGINSVICWLHYD